MLMILWYLAMQQGVAFFSTQFLVVCKKIVIENSECNWSIIITNQS